MNWAANDCYNSDYRKVDCAAPSALWETCMPFGSFKTLAEAIRGLQVTELREDFVEPLSVPVSDYFRSELELTLSTHDVECSESAVCENLLYPILREALK